MRLSVKRLGVGLTTNVVILAVVSFFVDLSSEIIFPLLPFFLVVQLGASYFIVGIMEGFAELMASVIKVFSGYWSDRSEGRKRFIVSGYGISAVTKVFFGLSSAWQHIFPIRILERAGKGIREPPRDALIAESSPSEKVGKAFGFQRALDTSGAILGPIFGIILLSIFVSAYQPIFLIATIPAFIAFLLTFLLREKKRREGQSVKPKIGLKYLPIRLRVFIVISSIFALGNFSFFFLMLRPLGLGQSETTTIVFYLIMNISFAVSALPAGILSDRIGRVKTIAVGYVFFATACLFFVYEIGPILIGVAFVIFGLSSGFLDVVQRVFICDMAPEDMRASSLGTFHMSTGVARLGSNLVAGALWSFLGVQFAFMYGVVMSMIAATMLAGISKA